MGLITLLLLVSFSLLYASKAWPKRPEFVDKAVGCITENVNNLALGGFIYGLVMLLVIPVMVPSAQGLLIRFLANIMLIAMALPHVFERLVAKYETKINGAILKEVRSLIGWISRNEVNVGIVGGVVSLLLFAVLFR